LTEAAMARADPISPATLADVTSAAHAFLSPMRAGRDRRS